VPHRSSPMPASLHPHRWPRRRRHHQHRRRSSVASGPSAAGDPARHLEPGRAGAPHHRPLKAGHRPAAGDTRRRHGGWRTKKEERKTGRACRSASVARSPTGRPATTGTITAGIADGHQAAASSRGGCGLGETLTAPPPLLCAGIWAGWAKQALPGHSRPAGPHRRKTAAHRPHISSVSRSPSDPLNFRKVQKNP
jgi:hypothetical protein